LTQRLVVDPRTETWRAVAAWIQEKRALVEPLLKKRDLPEADRNSVIDQCTLLDELEGLVNPQPEIEEATPEGGGSSLITG